ncbi:hypothetical protein [Roseivirga echinicomitans]|uniref:DUF5074 domain-containing protein n=1 Tax=Roseivirga echinicomitans TaxID=296218 RepID=A0A150X9L5_9BACT|nr:hypothetical protein [Roseivirga echinicomitans]KYG75437.1 hypothetical protein AWN68_07785 [Roseivirga echinicomitans]
MKLKLNASNFIQFFKQKVLRNSNLLFIVFLALFLQACEDDDVVDPAVKASQNLTFTKVMEPSKFAAANSISVSPNERYMIFSYEENTTVTHYYSKDGGETAQELPVHTTISNRNWFIETNITNDGLFVFAGSVYDLDNVVAGSAGFTHGTAVTESGKVVYINHIFNQGKTFEIYENGAYVSTGVKLIIDESKFLGVSGEKLGFFDVYNKTIAEFDVSTKTYTETKLTDLNYNGVPGTGLRASQIKTAYNQGYFAYAKDGGCIIISPTREFTYYSYPVAYQNYQNTQELKLFGNRAYVKVSNGNEAPVILEATGGSITETDYQFPLNRTGNNIYTQGFIENGSCLNSGIIKETSGSKAYLPLNFKEELYRKVHVIDGYIYYKDKVYKKSDKTFATSPIGTIQTIYYDTDKTFAYTNMGTFTSTDGLNWIERSTTQPRPALITKSSAGTFHGLGVAAYNYTVPGTGFSSIKFDQKGYTSANGVDWTLTPGSVKNGLGSGGPSFMSSTGVVVYNENTNPQGNQVLVTHVSEDYGVSYQMTPSSQLPEGFRTSLHETRNGKFISVLFEFSGEMTVWVCDTAKGGCTSTVSTPAFNSTSLYSGGVSSYTGKDEFVVSTQDGVYVSSSF